MMRKEYGPLLTTVIASSIGGAVKSYLFRDEVMTAQEPSTNAQILVVEEFLLVDKSGRTRAFPGLRHDGSPVSLSLIRTGKSAKFVFLPPMSYQRWPFHTITAGSGPCSFSFMMGGRL